MSPSISQGALASSIVNAAADAITIGGGALLQKPLTTLPEQIHLTISSPREQSIPKQDLPKNGYLVKAVLEQPTSNSVDTGTQDLARLRALYSLDTDKHIKNLLRSYTELRSSFFSESPYIEWCEGRTWRLICYEEPRSGKTTFAARIAQDIAERHHSDRLVVLSIFLGHGKKKSGYQGAGDEPVKALLRAILRKLHEAQIKQQRRSRSMNDLPLISNAIESMSVQKLRNMVDCELGNFDDVFLVIDGLDAISNSQAQASLEQEADRLVKLIKDKARPLRLIYIQSRTNIYEPRWIRCNSQQCGYSQGHLYWQCDICSNGDYHLCDRCFKQQGGCLDKSHQMREPYPLVEVYTHPSPAYLRDYLATRLEHERNKNSIPGRELSDAQALIRTMQDRIADESTGSFTIVKLAMDYVTKGENLHDVLEVLPHLAKHESDFIESYVAAIVKEPRTEDRIRGLAALAIAARTYEGNRAMSFDILAEAIHAHTKHICEKLTPPCLFRITRNLLDISAEVVRVVNIPVFTFLRENCAAHFDPLQLDLGHLCMQQVLDIQDQLPVASEDIKAILSFAKKRPFAWYSLQHWGCYLDDTSSPDVKKAAKTLLEQYSRSPKLRQAMFLAVNTESTVADETWSGSHMLHVLAYFNLASLLDEIVEESMGININVKDVITGQTPLHIACAMNHWQTAVKLIERGADPTISDNNGRTALSVAFKHMGLVESLLNQTTSFFRDKLLNRASRLTGGWTPLISAIRGRNTSFARILIRQLEIDVNIQDDLGFTALHHAALASDMHTFQLLLNFSQVGTQIPRNHNIRAKHSGRTACMLLLENSSYEKLGEDEQISILDLLLQQGMSLEVRDDYGRTLLHYASANKFLSSVVAHLVSKGMDPNAADEHNFTSLHVAAANGVLSTAEELVRRGANLHATDGNGCTACAIARVHKNSSLLAKVLAPGDHDSGSQSPGEASTVLGMQISNEPESFLADYGPQGRLLTTEQISQVDNNRSTLLHYASATLDVRIAKLLLQDDRIDVDTVNSDGKTALHISIDRCKDCKKPNPMAELLIDHKINLNVVDKTGDTALDRTLKKRQIDLALKLVKRGASLPVETQWKSLLWTAAIRKKEPEVMKILLQQRADVFRRASDGLLPSQRAVDDGADGEIQRLLEIEEQAILRSLGGALPRKDSQQE